MNTKIINLNTNKTVILDLVDYRNGVCLSPKNFGIDKLPVSRNGIPIASDDRIKQIINQLHHIKGNFEMVKNW